MLPPRSRRLPASFFAGDPASVARALLGVRLVKREGGAALAARVVETEAYGGAEDPACGRALRSPATRRAMAGPPGLFYMHRSYGHVLLNVVCLPAGRAAAVLVRAAEPLEGLDIMAARRPNARGPRELLRGPANLGRAFGLELSMTGLAVDGDALHFEPAGAPPAEIDVTTRVGLSAGTDLPWRFCVSQCPWVSGPRRVL